jgi:hypothetical protein
MSFLSDEFKTSIIKFLFKKILGKFIKEYPDVEEKIKIIKGELILKDTVFNLEVIPKLNQGNQ